MATKITITIPDNLDEQAQLDVRSILKDALHEFSTKRYPAEGYVADRYVGIMGRDEAIAKTAQVARRTKLAKTLWEHAFDVRVTPASAVGTKLQHFLQMFDHALAHHAVGTKPDLVSLKHLLEEVFS